jgi:pyrimidine-nucleoside phosphorylase
MVSLSLDKPIDEARELCRAKLLDGSALEKFKQMVVAQGGDLDAFSRVLSRPVFKYRIQAMRSGYVSAIDAERTGRVALALGAGREKTTDRIDPLAGVRLSVSVGDKVSVGSPLATLEKSTDPDGLEKAAAEMFKAFVISQEKPQDIALVLERID